MNAYVFPGQGSQFPGMGKDLYDQHRIAKILFESANEILDFDITKIMFEGTKEELKQTRVTQPAIYIYSVIVTKIMGSKFQPDALAGHSLGEFSALAAAETISFDSGLRLVSQRAEAMQMACDVEDGTMAAILGLDDEKVVEICRQTQGVVVAANFNCPGQLVISGEFNAVEKACESLKEKGARRALILPVSGAFHSDLMKSASNELKKGIDDIDFKKPGCPIYQNFSASAVTDPLIIQANLLNQLTGAVLWSQSINKMIKDGVKEFIEVGPGNILQGLIKKIDGDIVVNKI